MGGRRQEIQEFYNMVGPAIRQFENIFVRGQHEQSADERVNNMTQQQFDDHMNELFMRDNQKPIEA